MKVYEVFDQVEVQGEVRFVRYDFNENRIVELTRQEAMDRTIGYMYVENGILIFEVDNYDDE